MNKLFFVLMILFCQSVFAQDTLLLISGRKIAVSSVDVQDNEIAYRKVEAHSKLKKIEPYRVFSIIYRDGNEKIIYKTDSIDPLDFKVEEMRSFIIGVQDARILYKNNLVKVLGFGVGAGSGLLAFYGLVGPPIYSTVLGSFSPNVEKNLTFKVSGNAVEALGISKGKYLNEITGTNINPVIKKNQKLKLACGNFRFNNDITLDSTISMINSRFDFIRIHASNENGKLKLFKSTSTNRITETPYQEGFEKKVRDYKIRNGMISGLIGFVFGGLVYYAGGAADVSLHRFF